MAVRAGNTAGTEPDRQGKLTTLRCGVGFTLGV